MVKYYAGIGSRKTPPHILDDMRNIATRMSQRGYILNSGGASGADTAFEQGADPRMTQIFLPWRGFNGHSSPLTSPSPRAYEIAEQFHPNWQGLSQAARNLMARNSHQVLGRTLDEHVEIVICWTPEGRGGGGTGQAIRIAHHYGIRVVDLANTRLTLK